MRNFALEKQYQACRGGKQGKEEIQQVTLNEKIKGLFTNIKPLRQRPSEPKAVETRGGARQTAVRVSRGIYRKTAGNEPTKPHHDLKTLAVSNTAKGGRVITVRGKVGSGLHNKLKYSQRCGACPKKQTLRGQKRNLNIQMAGKGKEGNRSRKGAKWGGAPTSFS